MKRFVFLVFALLAAAIAHAQFTPGQTLTAAELNAALAGPAITSGTIDGATIGGTTPAAATFTTATFTGHTRSVGTGTPTVASGGTDCGTSPVIVGSDGAMRLTVGTSTNGGVCTVTFHAAWTAPPVCVMQNETTANLLRPEVTASVLKFHGTLTAGDSLVAQCVGY